MEVFGGVASAAQLMIVARKVIRYVEGVKHASEDQEQLLRETRSLLQLLLQIKEDPADREETRWLTAPDGPLDQLKIAMEAIAPKLVRSSGLRGMATKLRWPDIKKDIESVLGILERCKSLINLFLTNKSA